MTNNIFLLSQFQIISFIVIISNIIDIVLFVNKC